MLWFWSFVDVILEKQTTIFKSLKISSKQRKTEKSFETFFGRIPSWTRIMRFIHDSFLAETDLTQKRGETKKPFFCRKVKKKLVWKKICWKIVLSENIAVVSTQKDISAKSRLGFDDTKLILYFHELSLFFKTSHSSFLTFFYQIFLSLGKNVISFGSVNRNLCFKSKIKRPN